MKWFYLPVVLVLLTLSGVLFIHPSNAAQNQIQTKYKRARFVPISNRLITIRLTSPENGCWFVARQYEGGMIRLEKDDNMFGVAPLVRDQNGGEIELRFYRITKVNDKAGGVIGEALQEMENVEHINYQFTELKGLKDLLPLRAEVLDVQESVSHAGTLDADLEDPSSSELTTRAGDDQCCMTCNSITVCACRVSGSCGTCCLRHCC